MKRKKFFSLVALFALAVGMVLALAPSSVQAGDLTNMSDTMSSVEVDQDSTHEIVFTTETDLNDTDKVQVEFPTDFDDTTNSVDNTSFSVSDDTADCTWTVDSYSSYTMEASASCSSGPHSNATITVSLNSDMRNPSTADEYEILLETLDSGDNLEDNGYVSVSIVDDDTVNVNGYIDTSMTFDIDTSEIDEDCDASGGSTPCDSHGAATDDAGYVVDLGEMTLTSVNSSGDSVTHADGLTGEINSIWFDLSTNADGGAVVTVVSLNEELEKDSSNEIPSVARALGEVQIDAGGGLYGLNHTSANAGNTNATTGSVTVNTDCDCTTGDDYYCGVDDSTGGSPLEIFNTGTNPVDEARVEFSVGAAPDAADGTGTYTDELTFVATGTF